MSAPKADALPLGHAPGSSKHTQYASGHRVTRPGLRWTTRSHGVRARDIANLPCTRQLQKYSNLRNGKSISGCFSGCLEGPAGQRVGRTCGFHVCRGPKIHVPLQQPGLSRSVPGHPEAAKLIACALTYSWNLGSSYNDPSPPVVHLIW